MTRPRPHALTPLVLLAALAAPAAAPADDVGRLFFTPQQRQELDRRRNTNEKESSDTVVERSVTVNGQVTRSSGRSTTWVNGVPQNDSYRTVDRSHVRLEDTTVKVGETLDRSRGQVTDVVTPGAISVKRGAAQ